MEERICLVRHGVLPAGVRLRRTIARIDLVKPQTKVALPLVELAGMFALFVTGWVAARLYELTPVADQDRGQLLALREVFLGLGESIRTNFHRLDEDLASATKDHDPDAQARFEAASQDWNAWLD